MLLPYERETNLVFKYIRLVVTVHFTIHKAKPKKNSSNSLFRQ